MNQSKHRVSIVGTISALAQSKKSPATKMQPPDEWMTVRVSRQGPDLMVAGSLGNGLAPTANGRTVSLYTPQNAKQNDRHGPFEFS